MFDMVGLSPTNVKKPIDKELIDLILTKYNKPNASILDIRTCFIFAVGFAGALKAHANGRNKCQQLPTMLGVVGQQCCVRLHGPKSLTGFKLYVTSANRCQHCCGSMQTDATSHNIVGPNNVGCCWLTMLGPFAWAFRLKEIISIVRKNIHISDRHFTIFFDKRKNDQHKLGHTVFIAKA